MELMMYIGNDLIESIPLDQRRIQKPGYLGNFKRALKLKYDELIKQNAKAPDFLVINNTPQVQKEQYHFPDNNYSLLME